MEAASNQMAVQANSTAKGKELQMSTAHLLRQILMSVRAKAPDARVSIPRMTTWTSALAIASESLRSHDNEPEIIIPERSKEHHEAVKKLVLAQLEQSRSTPEPREKRIRTTYPAQMTTRPPKRWPKEEARRLAKEAIASEAAIQQSFRQPYVFTTRAALTEGTLATVSGTLSLETIDDPEFNGCKVIVPDMLWDTGSHGCIITEDLLPSSFANQLAAPLHDPYRNASGTKVQVQGYLALSNCQFAFETIFTVVPLTAVPNGRSGVILGQRGFIDHMVFKMEPRVILERRGQRLEAEEWGDLSLLEWVDAVTGEVTAF